MERKQEDQSSLRFPLIAVLLAGILYGVGYYPAASYDAPHGTLSLALGLGLVLFLIVPSYFVTNWALGETPKTFLIAFGVGFLARLIVLVVLFILYTKFVRAKDVSFTLAFGLGYLVISFFEILCFKSAILKDQTPRQDDAEQDGS
ncbi:MAG: hypothetical protein KJ645_12555 [Planctomycetes bacterium]|nr:hypothetical protein [Planctomycetota bacterium]